MTSTQWRPVNPDELRQYKARDFHIAADTDAYTMDSGLSVGCGWGICERVPEGDDAITADRLRAAGWRPIQFGSDPEVVGYQKVGSRLSGNISVLFYPGGSYIVIGPGGCKFYIESMQHLQSVVSAVGGEA